MPNEKVQNLELIRYVALQFNAGFSEVQIKNAILSQGYSDVEAQSSINSAKTKLSSFQSNQIQVQGSPLVQNVTKKKRPVGISVIAILYFISGVFCCLYGLFGLILGSTATALLSAILGPMAAFLGGFIVVFSLVGIFMGLLTFYIGMGLWSLKNWARVTALVFSILSLFTIIGIPVGAIFIYLLVNKKTKEAFKNN